MSFNCEATKEKSKHPDKNKASTTKLVTKAAAFIRSSTFNFWLARDRKAIKREIDAKLEREFKPKSITKATYTSAMVLDQIDLANSHNLLNDHLNKRIKDRKVKLKQELKNAKCLNYLGDTATKKSNPTKNDTSSKKCASTVQQLHQTLLPERKGRRKKRKQQQSQRHRLLG